MDRRADLIRRIKDHLAIYAVRVDMDKGEASKAAEDFYCDLLNILLGYNLQNMNRVRPNFPAIDLGEDSDDRKLGIQVTSTTTRQKVQDTLDTFFRHGLEKTYTHLTMLVIGKWTESRKSFRMDGTLDFDPNRDIWDTDWLLAKIESIQDIDHLKRIMTHLEQHLELVQLPPAPLDLPLRTAMDERNFVGRERELAEIAERFKTERIVVLSGLGGMGKTELAVRFGRDYAIPGVRRAYFVNFRKDFFHTVTDEIALGIEGLTEQKLDEDGKFRAALAVLRSCSPDDLLILDNADTEEGSFEQLRRELSVLPMHILITTRCDAVGAIDVAALHREELHRIFRLYADGVSEADMDALIDAVDAHTLTVDLMARSMRPGRRAATPEKLLNALKNRDLTSEFFMKIATSYPGGASQARIHEHLRVVFKVAELSDDEKMLLRCATLLPNSGMDDELFMVPFEEDKQDVLDDLIQKGWLLWKNKLLYIHPVIRIVCRGELRPTKESCEAFLDVVWEQYCEVEYDEDILRQIAELFNMAYTMLESCHEKWANRAMDIFWNLSRADLKYGNYECALDNALRVRQLQTQCLPENHPQVVLCYQYMSMTYGALGDHKQALNYEMKALMIREKIIPPQHPELATFYSNAGDTCGTMGENKLALENYERALVILEDALPTNHQYIVMCCGNIAVCYARMDDLARASEYATKALRKAEQSMIGDPNLEIYQKIYQMIKLYGKMRELGMNPPNPFK